MAMFDLVTLVSLENGNKIMGMTLQELQVTWLLK